MLEVKWKADCEERADDMVEGFNPCYVGSKMERKKRVT